MCKSYLSVVIMKGDDKTAKDMRVFSWGTLDDSTHHSLQLRNKPNMRQKAVVEKLKSSSIYLDGKLLEVMSSRKDVKTQNDV